MELKGKVVSVGKCWDAMYPAMAAEGALPTKARVEVELAHDGGRLCLNVSPKEAQAFKYCQEVTVEVDAGDAVGDDESAE